MANPSVSIPDDLLVEFDETIMQRKLDGDLDRDLSRSEVIQCLVRWWIDEEPPLPAFPRQL